MEARTDTALDKDVLSMEQAVGDFHSALVVAKEYAARVNEEKDAILNEANEEARKVLFCLHRAMHSSPRSNLTFLTCCT